MTFFQGCRNNVPSGCKELLLHAHLIPIIFYRGKFNKAFLSKMHIQAYGTLVEKMKVNPFTAAAERKKKMKLLLCDKSKAFLMSS